MPVSLRRPIQFRSMPSNSMDPSSNSQPDVSTVKMSMTENSNENIFRVECLTVERDANSADTLVSRSQIMKDVKEGLQYVFQTRNPTTLCIGSCDNEMEAVLCNLIEEDDIVLVGVTGEFGRRAVDIVKRCDAECHVVEARSGTALTYQQLKVALEMHKPNVFFLVHGDASTGVLQPIEAFGRLCRRYFRHIVALCRQQF